MERNTYSVSMKLLESALASHDAPRTGRWYSDERCAGCEPAHRHGKAQKPHTRAKHRTSLFDALRPGGFQRLSRPAPNRK